jgi:hypothetical protein
MELTMTVAESCQKNAVLKREEGIGRPLDLSHQSVIHGLLTAFIPWSLRQENP